MKTSVNKISFVISLFILVAFVPFTAFGDTILSFEPVAPVNVGSLFDVSVNIFDVTNLYAYQFDITFDPTILSAQNVAEGTIWTSNGNFFGGIIDNTGGTVTYIINSLIGDSSVSGDGPFQLAVINFQALSSGSSPLAFSYVLLLDPSQAADLTYTGPGMPATTNNGTIDVNSAPIPEPATLLLMGLGSALMGGGIKRLRRRFGKKEILA